MITGDEKTALDSPDIVVFASPSAYMRAISKRLSPLIRQGQIIVNVAKGVEENTLMPVCDVIKEEIPQADVCVAFRTKPCRRSKPRTPYYVCSQCPQKKRPLNIFRAFL